MNLVRVVGLTAKLFIIKRHVTKGKKRLIHVILIHVGYEFKIDLHTI